MPEVPAVHPPSQLFSMWRDEFIENGKNVFEQRENPGQQLLNEIEQYKLIECCALNNATTSLLSSGVVFF